MAGASSGRLIDLHDRGAVRHRTLVLAAHRGGGPAAPENSLAALDSAAAAGFDLVEIDVAATRDGVPVLFHPDSAGTMRTACGVGVDLFLTDAPYLDLFGARRRH